MTTVQPLAATPDPEFPSTPPKGQATMHIVAEGRPKPLPEYAVSGWGRGVDGTTGPLGNQVHAAAEMVRADNNRQAQGVFEAEKGAFEIRPLAVLRLVEGDIVQGDPLQIDPPQDASGYVPDFFEQHDSTLKAVVGNRRFAWFTGSDKDGKMQDIIDGPPGQSYPPQVAILPRR